MSCGKRSFVGQAVQVYPILGDFVAPIVGGRPEFVNKKTTNRRIEAREYERLAIVTACGKQRVG